MKEKIKIQKRSAIGEFRSEVDTFRDLIRKTVQEVQEKEFEKYKKQISDLRLSIENLSKVSAAPPTKELISIKEKIGEIDTLKTASEKLGKGLSEVNSKIESLRPEIPVKDIDTLKKVIEENKTHIAGIENTIANLPKKETLEEIENKIKKIEVTKEGKAVDKLRNQVENVLKNIETRQSEIDQKINKINESVKKIDPEKWKNELDNFKKRFEKMDVKVLEEEVRKEFEQINNNVKEMLKKSDEEKGKLETDVRNLNEKIESVTKLQKTIEELGIANIRRDLEILKTKQQWLESNLEKFNLKPIYARLQELENKIKSISFSSPVVLE